MRKPNVVLLGSSQEEEKWMAFFSPEVQPRYRVIDDPLPAEMVDEDRTLFILLDLDGEGNGLEKLRELRNSYADLPILLVTENPTREYLLAAIQLQVSNVLLPPFPKGEFLQAFHRAMETLESPPSPKGRESARPAGKLNFWQNLLRYFSGPQRKKQAVDKTAVFGITPANSLPFFNSRFERENASDINAQFFGRFSLKIRGKTIPRMKGKKNASLLAYLLFHHRKPIHREVLMETFWSDFTPASARNSLNVAICSIRKSLAKVFPDQEVILYDNESYCINSEMDVITDVDKFTYFWKKGKDIEASQGLTNALGAYNKAIGLYREEFLLDHRFEEWCEPERDKLKEIYLFILSKLSAYFYEEEQYDACVTICSKMLTKDNCLEEVHRKLMKCYNALGLSDLSLKQYYKCKKTLEEELHLAPSELTEDLFTRIQQGQPV